MESVKATINVSDTAIWWIIRFIAYNVTEDTLTRILIESTNHLPNSTMLSAL